MGIRNRKMYWSLCGEGSHDDNDEEEEEVKVRAFLKGGGSTLLVSMCHLTTTVFGPGVHAPTSDAFQVRAAT